MATRLVPVLVLLGVLVSAAPAAARPGQPLLDLAPATTAFPDRVLTSAPKATASRTTRAYPLDDGGSMTVSVSDVVQQPRPGRAQLRRLPRLAAARRRALAAADGDHDAGRGAADLRRRGDARVLHDPGRHDGRARRAARRHERDDVVHRRPRVRPPHRGLPLARAVRGDRLRAEALVVAEARVRQDAGWSPGARRRARELPPQPGGELGGDVRAAQVPPTSAGRSRRC